MIITSIRSHELNVAEASAMQKVGFEAWLTAFKNRTAEEIKHMYNPFDPEHVLAVTERYRRLAAKGIVCLAIEGGTLDLLHEGNIVGFMLAQNDVSGNVVDRAAKRILYPEKVYARAVEVNVHPDFQGQGIGKKLLGAGLEFFKPVQTPTVYVFKENEVVWNAVQRLGFELSPPDQEPHIMHDYFGEQADPVEQYRFAAPSVKAVLQNLR